MDKKKVKELLQDADICFLGYERNGCRDLVSMGLQKLHEAQEELSKSDWVSVEDGLPEYEEEVLVTGKDIPDDVRISYRTKLKHPSKDKNDFYCPNHYIVTHWKPIEKLEE